MLRPGLLAFVVLTASIPFASVEADPTNELDPGDTPGTWIPTPEELVQEVYAVPGLVDSEDPTPPTPAGPPTPKPAESDGVGAMASGRTDTKSKPVLLVHGRDQYNLNSWLPLRTMLGQQGYSGGVYVIGYYGGECMGPSYVSVLHHGSHNKWYGGSREHVGKKGCDGGATSQIHDLDTDIRHLAFHLAWAIYEHWSKNGVAIDVVSHSMGGLLIRYAVAMTATNHADWPTSLLVEDVVTMNTPHKGTISCGNFPWDDLEQMCRSSSTMQWMTKAAQNPQSDRATDWTLMGTECDFWLTTYNHIGMAAAHTVIYPDEWSGCYGHTNIYQDVSTTQNARVFYSDAPDHTQYAWNTAPRSGLWASYALYVGDW